MKKSICLLYVTCSLLSRLSQAQEEKEADTLQGLVIFEGNWSVNKERRLSANGPWESSSGKSIITRNVRAKLFEEDFAGTIEGRPFFTKTLFARNNLTGKYQIVFIDSEHGTLVDFEGQQENKAFIFDRLWVYPNKTTVKLRVIFTVISPNEFSVESMRMPQNLNTWDVTERMKYARMY